MQSLDAKKVINDYEEEHLADIFYHYGELREARKLAREIVHHRKNKAIETTEDLKKLFSYIPVSYTHLDVYKRQLPINAYSGKLGSGQSCHFPLLFTNSAVLITILEFFSNLIK